MRQIDFEDVHDVTGWSTKDVDHLVLHKTTTWYEAIPPFYKNVLLIITQLCIFTIILRYQSRTVEKMHLGYNLAYSHKKKQRCILCHKLDRKTTGLRL